MQTFLPSGYSFSLDKLVDLHLKHDIQSVSNANIWNPFTYLTSSEWVCLLLVLLCFIAVIVIIHVSIGGSHRHLVRNLCLVGSGLLFTDLITILLLIFYTSQVQMTNISYYSAAFKYSPESNLQVEMLEDQSTPRNVRDVKKYPYRLMNGNYMKLGKMCHGKFTPYTNKGAVMFYKYYAYINKHHLADKFDQKIIFKKDGRYTNTDGHAQWVLTNGRDLVLHLNDNSQIEQSKLN